MFGRRSGERRLGGHESAVIATGLMLVVAVVLHDPAVSLIVPVVGIIGAVLRTGRAAIPSKA
jgi:hypothetical protein